MFSGSVWMMKWGDVCKWIDVGWAKWPRSYITVKEIVYHGNSIQYIITINTVNVAGNPTPIVQYILYVLWYTVYYNINVCLCVQIVSPYVYIYRIGNRKKYTGFGYVQPNIFCSIDIFKQLIKKISDKEYGWSF